MAHDKCYWYLIDFAVTGKKWRHKTIQELPGELTMPKGEDRTPTPIKRYEVSESEKLLGLELPPDRSQENQFQ